jgi:protein-S-isoprenylcysteine O-methyltransferase Ste14
MSTASICLLAVSWIAYFCLHSLFASLQFKRYIAQHWPILTPAYRLLFNAVSIVLLPIPLLIQYNYAGAKLWQWNGISAIIANGLTIAAVVAFFWTLKYYDSADFSGLKQYREKLVVVEDQEHFVLSPLHRYVRHPWYFLILIILWTRAMDEATLISTVLITAYIVVGSRLEEHKLMVYHGDVYRNYRQQVSALIPVPWKYMKKIDVPDQ